MRSIYKLTMLALITLLSACATNVSVIPADQNKQQQAMSFNTNPKAAKVYFVGGKTGNMIKTSMPGGAILFIDGIRVGQIDKDDVMVFDLKPKQYSFAWQYPSGDSQMQFLQRDVKAGDIVILEATWNTGGAGLGFLGMMASPAKYELKETLDRTLVMGKRVIVPQSCPNTICEQ